MNSIKHNKKSEPCQEKISRKEEKIVKKFLEAVMQDDDARRYLSAFYHPHDGSEYLTWTDWQGPSQPGCPFHVPASLALGGAPKVRDPKAKVLLRDRYPALYSQLVRGYVEDDTLDSWTLDRYARRPIVAVRQEHGGYLLLRGTIRGDASYASRQRSCVDAVVTCMEGTATQWGLATLTLSPDRVSGDLIADARVCSASRRVVTRYLVEHLGCAYLWVREVTAKGRTHIHLLFSHDGDIWPVFKHHEKMRFRDRGLKDRLEALWGLGYVDVLAVSGDRAGRYVSKYLCKGSSLKGALIDDATTVVDRDARRKCALGLAVASLAGVRLMGYGGSVIRPLRELRARMRESRRLAKLSALSDAIDAWVWPNRLDNLLNNFPCKSGRFVAILTKKQQIAIYNPGEQLFADKGHPFLREFLEEATFVGCPGCKVCGSVRGKVIAEQEGAEGPPAKAHYLSHIREDDVRDLVVQALDATHAI